MTNPFESGQIRNYILFYVAVVIIMILFFTATTLFQKHDKKIVRKIFETNTTLLKEQPTEEVPTHKRPFKLLEKAY